MSSSRSGVLGFTEAELGLFLAIIFMGIAAFGAGTPTPPAVPNRLLSADSSRFAVVARLAAERDSLARVLVGFGSRRDSLNASESRLAARRDSLTATPEGGTSAERARRIALADSLGRADPPDVVGKADTSGQFLRSRARDAGPQRARAPCSPPHRPAFARCGGLFMAVRTKQCSKC